MWSISPESCLRVRAAFGLSAISKSIGTRCLSTTRQSARCARLKCHWRRLLCSFRGYPLQIEGASPGDLNYDYNRVSLTGPFQHQRGNYTRLGDVTALVKGVDDRYAIFGSGEEIATEFDVSKLPPLPAHWKRDYFFYANGYVKDMDWWDASPFTVAQMPFHAMSRILIQQSKNFPMMPARSITS